MQLDIVNLKDFINGEIMTDGNCFILETQYGYIGLFVHNGVTYKLPKVYVNPRINYVFDRLKVIAKKTFGIQLTNYQKIHTYVK